SGAGPIPRGWNHLQSGADLNDVIAGPTFGRLALSVPLLFFFIRAARLAASADTICSHWLAPAGVVGALCSMVLGKPHVVIEHSGSLHLLRRSKSGRLLARFVTRHSKTIVTVSSDLKSKLIAICPEAATKTVVMSMGVYPWERRRLACQVKGSVNGGVMAGVNSGVKLVTRTGTMSDPDPVEAARAGQPRATMAAAAVPGLPGFASGSCPPNKTHKILFIGRLVKIKGVDVLIRAVSELTDVELLIAGQGDQADFLKQLCKTLGLDARFLGPVAGTEARGKLYSDCDVVVVPSLILRDGRCEGMPRVCLEAMAAGKPLIASASGGLAELIVDGHNGLLFEPGNHKMLAAKLRELLDNSELSRLFSVRGRATAAAYDWSRLGPAFSELIQG
ncbi:MAG TPA: glycosyltransferase family 4 protein, partial [Blastocatellia bacterium]|nr:glycosyltransferase family 4 protein [Blastocatellia bacterium]